MTSNHYLSHYVAVKRAPIEAGGGGLYPFTQVVVARHESSDQSQICSDLMEKRK